MTTINWDDGDDHVEIISLTKDAGVKYPNADYIPTEMEWYRIRVKINGKYYVGHLEMSE